jgi:hypothetical protein
MRDPRTVILANLITQTDDEIFSAKISFLNAFTGEWYDIPVPTEARKYFWYDNIHFGFLSNDLQTIYLIDVSSGQVVKQPVPNKSTRLLDVSDSFSALAIKRDPLSSEDFIFDLAHRTFESRYSNNTRYSAERDYSQDEWQLIVTDSETGEMAWESNPSDGFWDVHFEWSPVNNSHIAFVAGKPDLSIGLELPMKDVALTVVDIESGEIVSHHEGNIGLFNWSSDGAKILYKDAASLYWNFGYGFNGAPCIFNTQTTEESCIEKIPNRPHPEGYTLITTDDYQWSPNGNSIYFTYSYSVQNGMIGNFCIYNLVDENIVCPTDNLSKLPGWDIDWYFGWRISTYDLSPDGEYVHFCLDSNHPLSDDQGGSSKDGLIDIHGTSLITWVSGQEVDGQYPTSRCSFNSAIWRPLP